MTKPGLIHQVHIVHAVHNSLSEYLMKRWPGRVAGRGASPPPLTLVRWIGLTYSLGASTFFWNPRHGTQPDGARAQLMDPDLSPLLNNWPFDARDNVRKIVDGNGRSLVQVRIADGPFQGILQMPIEGRPDGLRPHDRDFALDYWQDELRRRVQEGGNEADFRLTHAACQELFDESRRIYERYVFLLRLNEFEHVIRDTERNMTLFTFVNQHGERQSDRLNLERWWPFVLRVNATARVLQAVKLRRFQRAQAIIRATRKRITELPEIAAEEFKVERQRAFEALDELTAKIAKDRPRSVSEKLQAELDKALEQEDFEQAAKLRDQIATLRRLRQRVERKPKEAVSPSPDESAGHEG